MKKTKRNAFKIVEGKKKIIISAPHSTLHKRNDEIRMSETRTGQLARTIALDMDIYGIYKTVPELNDANWDKKCEYKNSLCELINSNNIKALIDIHGMAAFRKEDICIGINGGKNIKNKFGIVKDIVKILKNNGFKNVTIDEPFSAKHEYCVSTYTASKCNIIAFQIEINRKYRSKRYKEFSKYGNLENSLKEIIDMLEKEKVKATHE